MYVKYSMKIVSLVLNMKDGKMARHKSTMDVDASHMHSP